jgi:hypothetical protein
MLKKMKDLPRGVVGVEATGEVTYDDYQSVLLPIFEEAHAQNKKMKFVYVLGEGFTGMTAGAMWDDLKIGMKFMNSFDRAAVVSDFGWMRKSMKLIAPLMPATFKMFKLNEQDAAIQWAGEDSIRENITIKLVPDKKVLIANIHGALASEDFNYLAHQLDPLINDGGFRGLVLHADKFPGWENFGSMVKHFEFVKEHHKKIDRVAMSMDGSVMEIAPKFSSHFVNAEIKVFASQDVEKAVDWAST